MQSVEDKATRARKTSHFPIYVYALLVTLPSLQFLIFFSIMPSKSQDVASEANAKQQQPLMANNDVETQAKAKEKVSYSSLRNKKQLAILCIARLADPLAASSIQVETPQTDLKE